MLNFQASPERKVVLSPKKAFKTTCRLTLRVHNECVCHTVTFCSILNALSESMSLRRLRGDRPMILFAP